MKTINEQQLAEAVAGAVKNVLKEWMDFDTKIGIPSKNPKVRAAGDNAITNVRGNSWGNNDSDFKVAVKHNGGDNRYKTTLWSILIDMAEGDEKALEKFGKIYQNNQTVQNRVKNALSDIASKHIREFKKIK